MVVDDFFLKSWPRGLLFFLEKRALYLDKTEEERKKIDDKNKNIFVYKNKYIFKMRDIKRTYLYIVLKPDSSQHKNKNIY
jgi:hypothetical protein